VWCLAEPGAQYLVFSTSGLPFTLTLAPGQYVDNAWIDVESGDEKAIEPIAPSDQVAQPFTPPDTTTDWALVLRAAP